MSVMEKLYADLERERARSAILDRFIADSIEAFPGMTQHGVERSLRNGELVGFIRELLGALRELERIYALTPCSRCGEPIEWKAEDPLGKYIQEIYNQRPWAHRECSRKG
jgi:hypothetical protein